MVMVALDPVGGVTFTPAAVRVTFNVITPATVPVWISNAGSVVVPAGTVKSKVRPPPANWIEGSSIGTVAFETKVSVTVPDSTSG